MLEVRLEHSFPAGRGGFSLKVDLASASGRLALFGPSGSGKTLTLLAIAGLFRPRSGYIALNGRPLFDSGKKIFQPARLRRLGCLFQDYALFPHLTVRQNIAFALSGFFAGKAAANRRKVEEMLELFELRELADQYPPGISGGQKQRVALARALATGPELLLLDEPFSALDHTLRARIREQCAALLGSLDTPCLIITHDPDDVVNFAREVSFYENGTNTPCRNLREFERACVGPDASALLQARQMRDFPPDTARNTGNAFYEGLATAHDPALRAKRAER